MINKKIFENIFLKNLNSINKNINILKKNKILKKNLIEISNKIFNLKFQNNKIIIFGNGGSAAESQHFSAELVGRFLKNRYPVPSVCLNTDTSAITAIANDFGYGKVFSRQLSAIAHPNDIVFAISTSGKSQNILSALSVAKKMNCFTILLTGKKNKNHIADLILDIPGDRVDRIQELHLVVIHTLCELVECKINEYR